MVNDDRVKGLFAHFTRMRKNGYDRDSAWGTIEPDARGLPDTDRERLIAMLRAWETKEGRAQNSAANDPYATHYRPPEGLDEAQQQVKDSTTANSPAIRRIKPIDNKAKRTSSTVACPSCGTQNAPNELYCTACGALLVDSRGLAGSDDTQPLDRLTPGGDEHSGVFEEGMMLLINVREFNETIRVRPTNHELIIGRQSPNSVMLPDIDLSKYGGDHRGVSRLHAGLRRQANSLLLSDMGSLNYTYVNGQRLHAHEVRVLRDGDDVRFGQLLVTIRFARE